ncbi:CLUMA_CG004192, isoform A [Clunio marinus]|uniref:CLUMA_CG004192, isoform A n=1 Tax=Clunio marinus TaxID=568069 RepID=A0A1J1HQW9_9DIPT|nr:CLUMA_CG004192, isoform A [Clunio marinus]
MWVKESNYQLKLANQIFLFVNIFMSIAWILSCFILFYFQSSFLLELNFPLICFAIGFPMETLRLYLGYSGNIKNNVLDIAGFLILTTFIELPIHIYLLISLQDMLHRIGFIIQCAQLILLPFEIVLNFIILRYSLHERNLQFQMMYSNDIKMQ